MKEVIKNILLGYLGVVGISASLIALGFAAISADLAARLFPSINFFNQDLILTTVGITFMLIPSILSVSFWIPLLIIVGVVLYYSGVNSKK